MENMRKRTQAREFALQILYQHEMNPEAEDTLFKIFWQEHSETVEEIRQFTENLVKGTIQHQSELDEIIMRYAENWQLHRMATIDRNILRFATYELLFSGDIPPKVTINEAVNIAKKYSKEDSGKFVNGVLDKINHTEKRRTAPASEA
jgi:transcription antitermination factor NusB